MLYLIEFLKQEFLLKKDNVKQFKKNPAGISYKVLLSIINDY
ncbi:MAG: hypothetical protein RBS51_05040 [Anaerovoracaceae bacterium]|jgi:hypothetical protein|nr:hypothetical protein [Anaerovoracaceae bacterium]